MAKALIKVLVDIEIPTIMGDAGGEHGDGVMELSVHHIMQNIMQAGATAEGLTLSDGSSGKDIDLSYRLEA